MLSQEMQAQQVHFSKTSAKPSNKVLAKDLLSRKQQVPKVNCKGTFHTIYARWRRKENLTLKLRAEGEFKSVLNLTMLSCTTPWLKAERTIVLLQNKCKWSKQASTKKSLKLDSKFSQKLACLLIKQTVSKTTIQHQCTIWIGIRVWMLTLTFKSECKLHVISCLARSSVHAKSELDSDIIHPWVADCKQFHSATKP